MSAADSSRTDTTPRLWSAPTTCGDTDLFREFEVNFLDSSQSNIPKPFKFPPQTIESLINDIPPSTCNAREKKALLQHAAELRKCNLDKILERQWERKLNPIVHAEMILHDWL